MSRSLAFLGGCSLLAVMSLGDAYGAEISPRYQDVNHDLVADSPLDPSQWRDPRILIFAYTPVEDPAMYSKVWDEFIAHLEALTGKEVRFFPVQSNAAQLEAMRAGRLHIAGFNTGSTPIAVNCVGFVPFAMMAESNGNYGYQMEIITYPESGINTIEDLQGRTLAFTSPTSNSGFKAPSALLSAQFAYVADRDYKTSYSGSHDNSILGVVNKDYDAAAIANEVLFRMLAREVVNEQQYKTIYQSESFPTTGYGVSHDLQPELAAKIKEAFFSFEWEGTALQKEFADAGMEQFIPITYQEHWAVVRTIDAATNTIYNCD